jgi:lysophospholipase L1-like esterase
MKIPPSAPPAILCFGDSLTAGYQAPLAGRDAPQETPYGAFLQKRLGAVAQVVVSGVCGELTGEMVLRFRRDVIDRRPAFVVVLGGTNDLGWNAGPPEIMRNLIKMYEQALAAGIRPVAITVPSLRMDQGDPGWLQQHIARRRSLNALIGEYCGRRQVPCIDLFTATCEPDTLRLAAPYSNDGLHLSTEGYQLLADLLYTEVFAPALGLAEPWADLDKPSQQE